MVFRFVDFPRDSASNLILAKSRKIRLVGGVFFLVQTGNARQAPPPPISDSHVVNNETACIVCKHMHM